MVNVRKDHKGRKLRTGESQRKDGRYAYKYTNHLGEVCFVYSWKLESTDRLPKGKKASLSLREKEKLIERDLNDQINTRYTKQTVIQLVQKYLAQKTGVRHNTEANYRFVLNIIQQDNFGQRRIEDVKPSDAKSWLIELQKSGRGYSTIHCIRGVVRPAFQMAVDDDYLRKNPFDFQLASVVVNDSCTREALTRKQERLFLKFIAEDHHFSQYYDGFFILFKTGLRISEFVGLTLDDLDMNERKLRVDHQLQRKRDMSYAIEPTKTACGVRFIPMSDDVHLCFQRILAKRTQFTVEPTIDGKSGFLYLDKNGMPLVALHWEKYFQRICAKYNRTYKEQLPKITPHVCRHTFCSNMAKSGMNPKTLQYLMGHSDISVTLNTYTHLTAEDVACEFKRLSKLK